MPAALDPVPRHLRIPYRRMPVTHRLPHTVPPCTHGFPRNCMQCNLVPHSFQPSAPSAYSLGPRAPGARSIRPTMPPGACAIQPTAPQAPATSDPPCLQAPAASGPPRPSAYSPRPSTWGFHPTVRQTLPAYRTTRHLAPWHGPLLHIMHQVPTRQLPAVPAIRMSSAHSPPRLYTPSARDFPLMGTSVAHDPSHICALNVHGFSCVAQCAPSAPTFLAGLRFSIRCRASARQTHRASQRSSGRASTRAFFHATLISIPHVRFHIGHVGDGEERHGKARVLTRVVVLFGKRDKRSDRPAQIWLFTTQVI